MKFRLKKKYLNFGLAIFAAASFSLVSPVAFAEGSDSQATCTLKGTGPNHNNNPPAKSNSTPQEVHDFCSQMDTAVHQNSEAALKQALQNYKSSQNTNHASEEEGLALNLGGVNLQNAAQACSDAAKKCDTGCEESQFCSKLVAPLVADMTTEALQLQQAALKAGQVQNATNGTPSSNGSNGSGLSSALLPALLGAAAGFGAAKLMDKDKDKKDKDDANKSQDAVVCDANNNCAVDCTKDTAWEYSDCNEQQATACAGNLSDSTCQQFSNRFCSTETADGTTIDGYTKDKNGEGIGTAFCDKVAATNYCATSGRGQCPSCLQLNNSQLAACQANPSLCIAQNTADQIEQAKTTCPDDPIFANPAYTAGGSATVTDPNAPDPIVTDPNATAGTTTAEAASNPAASSSTSFVTTSTNNPMAQGQASDVASGNGSSGFDVGGSGGSGGMGVASVGGRTASGGILPGRVASASSSGGVGISRGPASDVSGPYSSSLFLESSQAIAKRCQQGRLLHCL